MKQRRLLVLAVVCSLSGWVARLRAQTSRGSMRGVGVLAPSTRAKEEITLKPFFDQTMTVAQAANPVAFDTAVAKLIADRVDAIIVVKESPLVGNLRTRLVELTNQKRLPVVSTRAQLADAGALFRYGASLADQIRRSALLLDKSLNGAKPADVPVEQATLFELVVNLKTARALGITIPLRADRVIE